MPSLYMLSGALNQANAIKTLYAGAKIRLFTGAPAINVNTLIADLEAAEATFTGYAEEVIAAWLGPMLAAGSGAQIWSGSLLFESAAPFTVQEVVTGWWLETAAGVLVMAGTFPSPISMGANGQALPYEIYLPFAVNP